MQIGFLARTPRGRCATRLAYNHLGINYTDGEAKNQLAGQTTIDFDK